LIEEVIMSGKYAFTKSLREIRFLFCQSSEQSAATRYELCEPGRKITELQKSRNRALILFVLIRSFLLRAYPTMKKNNPNIPIMLREAAGTAPRIYARYGRSLEDILLCIIGALTTLSEYGQEKSESLDGLTDKQIEDTVSGLVRTGVS
jgi:NADH dehydrogenase (ubiquinone) 1 alpha subcomplex subunit 2